MPRCKIESGKEKVESKYGRVNATSRTILVTTVSGPLFSKMHIKPIVREKVRSSFGLHCHDISAFLAF